VQDEWAEANWRGYTLDKAKLGLLKTDGAYGTNGISVAVAFSFKAAAEYAGVAGIFCCRSPHRSQMSDAFASEAG
jgi:hypothetical protein